MRAPSRARPLPPPLELAVDSVGSMLHLSQWRHKRVAEWTHAKYLPGAHAFLHPYSLLLSRLLTVPDLWEDRTVNT